VDLYDKQFKAILIEDFVLKGEEEPRAAYVDQLVQTISNNQYQSSEIIYLIVKSLLKDSRDNSQHSEAKGTPITLQEIATNFENLKALAALVLKQLNQGLNADAQYKALN